MSTFSRLLAKIRELSAGLVTQAYAARGRIEEADVLAQVLAPIGAQVVFSLANNEVNVWVQTHAAQSACLEALMDAGLLIESCKPNLTRPHFIGYRIKLDALDVAVVGINPVRQGAEAPALRRAA